MSLDDGIEIPVTSRFKLLDNPNALPGYCCVCHSPGGDGRKFIDFGFSLDVYGAVYFCTFCVTELAMAANFIPWKQFDEVNVKLVNVATELAVTDKSFKDYRDAVRLLLRDCNCADKLDSGPAVDSKPSIPKPRTGKSAPAGDDSKSE